MQKYQPQKYEKYVLGHRETWLNIAQPDQVSKSLIVISYLGCFLLIQQLGVEKVFALINPASLAAFQPASQLSKGKQMQITQTLKKGGD